ncbi:hypothetical protein D3C84_1151210 [compost metagenome]
MFSGCEITVELERDSAVRLCSLAGMAKALAARMDRDRLSSNWRFMVRCSLEGLESGYGANATLGGAR